LAEWQRIYKVARMGTLQLKSGQWRVVGFFASAILLLFGGNVGRAEILVVGKGERQVFDATGNQRNDYTYSFEITLSGNRWRSKVTFGSNTNHYEEFSFDGKECKGALLQAPEGVDTSVPGNTNVGWIGLVRTGPIPANGSPETKFLWIAYGSCSFLDDDKTRRLPAPWCPKGFEGADSFYYEVVRFEAKPGYPKSLLFRASDDLWIAETKASGRSKAAPPLVNGFVAAEYKVMETTNLQETTLPTVFEMKRFAAPRLSATTVGERYVFEHYTATVTAVRIVDQPELTTEIYHSTRARIYDFRFEERDYPDLTLTWKTESDTWPSATRPEIPDLVKRAKQDFDKQIRTSRKSAFLKYTIAFGVLTALIAIPLLLAHLRRGIRIQKP